jgi:hypothetical protein
MKKFRTVAELFLFFAIVLSLIKVIFDIFRDQEVLLVELEFIF